MKFHPILFSTPMVQAILEGRKTMTRRVVKPFIDDCTKRHNLFTEADWKDNLPEFVESFSDEGYWYCKYCGNGTGPNNEFKGIKSPYGKVGDVLWVRETWAKDIYDKPIFYRAQHEIEPYAFPPNKWEPLIFMPKEACRIFLQITDIKVERLQDISEEDAIAEGVKEYGLYGIKDYENRYINYLRNNSAILYARNSFETLWQKINGVESWNTNPWVWIISFKQIEKPENFI